MASPIWRPASVPQPWSEGTTSFRGSKCNSACRLSHFVAPYRDCQQGFQLVPAADCDNFKDWLSHHARPLKREEHLYKTQFAVTVIFCMLLLKLFMFESEYLFSQLCFCCCLILQCSNNPVLISFILYVAVVISSITCTVFRLAQSNRNPIKLPDSCTDCFCCYKSSHI